MSSDDDRDFGNDDVQIIARDEAYRGYMRVDTYRLRHRRHAGGWTGEMSRELIERGHAVAVLPYDPVLDQVVLIEQFRIGAYAAGRPPWQIEIVAGIIEAGESLEDVARRECIEECGCRIEALVHVCDILTSPGVMSETAAIYCGRTDTKGAGGVHGVAEEHEDIRAIVLGAETAFAWLDQGRIINSPAVIALQWLRRERERLREDWCGGE
jgi:ADP-ribose pyrophosphatase